MTRIAGRRWSELLSWQRALCGAVLAAFAVLYAINAFIVDDAYITFRTIDNVLHGHGLTWNVGERVQVYTHPLWMLALIPFAGITGEVFYTVLAVSFGCLLATFALLARGWRGQSAALRTAAIVALVAACKPIMDFTSSGLEQPLAYVWLSLFFVRLRVKTAPTPRDLGVLVLIASLACVTRQDTLLLYGPALVLVARRIPAPRRGAIVAVAAGLVPIVAWHAFSLLYYGSLVPNTAHAKLLGPALGLATQTGWGLRYVLASLAHDPASVLLLAGVFGARRRYDGAALALLAGAGLYVAYTIGFAAVSTHMLGRFLALPLFLAAVVLCDALPQGRALAIPSAAAAVTLIANPTSALHAGSRRYDRAAEWQKEQIDRVLGAQRRWGDTKWMTLREHAGAMAQIPGVPVPRHGWYFDGLEFRDAPERLQVGGALAGSPVGFFAYAAGPRKIVVDLLALTDPLRARLPACGMVRPGHFLRPLPEGYVESLLTGENRLIDPSLRAFYDLQRRVLRDPLWSPARLRAIVDLNLGCGRPLLAAYVHANADAFDDEACKSAVMAARGRYPRPPAR